MPLTAPWQLPYAFIALAGAWREGATARQRRAAFARRMGAWYGRPAFWLRLGMALWVGFPQESQAFVDWLHSPLSHQWESALRAWVRLPRDGSARRRRARLQHSAACRTSADRREAATLAHLGVWRPQGGWTQWGRAALQTPEQLGSPHPRPWVLHPHWLEIPLPADWPLLWQIEQWLTPESPGHYPLPPWTEPLASRLAPLLRSGGAALPPTTAGCTFYLAAGVLASARHPTCLDELLGAPWQRPKRVRRLSPHHAWFSESTLSEIQRRLQNQQVAFTLSSPPAPQPLPMAASLWFPCLEAARLAGQCLCVRYLPPEESAAWRCVTPLVWEIYGGWRYLWVHDHGRGAERLLRLDRIIALALPRTEEGAAPRCFSEGKTPVRE